MWLEPRPHPPRWLVAAAPLGATALAMLLAAVPLGLAGADVGAAYRQMAAASLGSWFALSETLTRATPLILTGLAVAVAFRARLWNIGAEASSTGAVAAVAVGSGAVAAPPQLLVPLLLAASAAAGALLMLGPTWLKLRLGVDEVVTTLLLNYVALLFVGMLLEGPMQDPMSLGWPQSAPVVADAELPRLVERTRVHAGLVVALAAAALVWLYLSVRSGVSRSAPSAATRGRRASPACPWLACCPDRADLGGARRARRCGRGRGPQGLPHPGPLARLRLQRHCRRHAGAAQPLGVVLAAVFVAAVFVGADGMSRTVGVPSYIADLVVALAS